MSDTNHHPIMDDDIVSRDATMIHKYRNIPDEEDEHYNDSKPENCMVYFTARGMNLQIVEISNIFTYTIPRGCIDFEYINRKNRLVVWNKATSETHNADIFQLDFVDPEYASLVLATILSIDNRGTGGKLAPAYQLIRETVIPRAGEKTTVEGKVGALETPGPQLTTKINKNEKF